MNYIFTGGDTDYQNVFIFLLGEPNFSNGGTQPTMLKSWFLTSATSHTYAYLVGTYMDETVTTFYAAIS